MSQDRMFVQKRPWKWHRWAQKLESQGWGKKESLLETQMWFLPASSVGGRLSQETMAFANTSVWDKSNPPTLASKPDNSVFPICPWHLFSCCLSIGSQNDSVYVCEHALLRNIWDSSSLLSLSHNLHWFLQTEIMENSLYCNTRMKAEPPRVSGGTSEAEIYFLIFNHHTWYGVCLFCVYHFCQYRCGSFFIFLLIRLLFS